THSDKNHTKECYEKSESCGKEKHSGSGPTHQCTIHWWTAGHTQKTNRTTNGGNKSPLFLRNRNSDQAIDTRWCMTGSDIGNNKDCKKRHQPFKKGNAGKGSGHE